MSSCIFCKIANKEIPAKICYEDSELLAFEDIGPQAPVHTLIIPRQCIATVDHLSPDQAVLVGKMVLTAQKLAREKGIVNDGYRLVFNCGDNGGQAVHHLHLHLLGGRKMTWPPG